MPRMKISLERISRAEPDIQKVVIAVVSNFAVVTPKDGIAPFEAAPFEAAPFPLELVI